MSSSSWHHGWQYLPDHIFGDIMMMINLQKSHETYMLFYRYEYEDKFEDRCRQVCRRWNWMIMQMTKHRKDIIRKRLEILAARLKSRSTHLEVPTVVSLNHHGLLYSVEELNLWCVNIAKLPAEHLVSLVSCVTERVFIKDVRNFDMVTLLDSVQCVSLEISSQSLSTEETWAVVRAMESNVEVLTLMGGPGNFTLDMAVLSQYSGQGKCYKVICYEQLKAEYEEQMRTWAKKIKWEVYGGALVLISSFDLDIL